MSLAQTEGMVVAVCSSANGSFLTHPQDAIELDPWGVVGHVPPDEATGALVRVVSREVTLAFGEDFELDIRPGDFNEQIATWGLDDLTGLSIGDVLVLGGVRLWVAGHVWPSRGLFNHLEVHGETKGHMWNSLVTWADGRRVSRAGVLARVLVGGVVEAETSVYAEAA